MSIRLIFMAAAVALGATAPSLAAAQSGTAAKPQAPSPAQNRTTLTRMLDAQFKVIDANGNGTLDTAELTAAEAKVQQQRLGAMRAQFESNFTRLDTNKNGSLSKAEFMAAAPQTAKNPPNGAAVMAQLDTNKDGRVSSDEYRTPVLSRFDKLDANKDGTVSPAERQAAARK